MEYDGKRNTQKDLVSLYRNQFSAENSQKSLHTQRENILAFIFHCQVKVIPIFR
jgi:hypothetical protein